MLLKTIVESEQKFTISKMSQGVKSQKVSNWYLGVQAVLVLVPKRRVAVQQDIQDHAWKLLLSFL